MKNFNWAGASIALGLIYVGVVTAPWGLIALVVLWLALSGKLWKG